MPSEVALAALAAPDMCRFKRGKVSESRALALSSASGGQPLAIGALRSSSSCRSIFLIGHAQPLAAIGAGSR